MGSVVVVRREICSKYSPQVVFAEDNDMIGTFAPNAFLQSLNIRILPGTAVGRQYLLCPPISRAVEIDLDRYYLDPEAEIWVRTPKAMLR